MSLSGMWRQAIRMRGAEKRINAARRHEFRAYFGLKLDHLSFEFRESGLKAVILTREHIPRSLRRERRSVRQLYRLRGSLLPTDRCTDA
jgi:hypothetical protein